MNVVSDSSPIIFLSKLKLLDLLKKQYKNITLPLAVYQELTSVKKYDENIKYIKSFDFKTKKADAVDYDFDVGKGEKAAIVLALEEKADLLLLDDYVARRIAKYYNIKVRGTLGVLMKFLEHDFIEYEAFEVYLQKLVSHKFRIDIQLYNYVLGYAKRFR